MKDLIHPYPATCRLAREAGLDLPQTLQHEELPDYLKSREGHPATAPYLVDLARVEWQAARIAGTAAPQPPAVGELSINPRLTLVPVSWKGLPECIAGEKTPLMPAAAVVLVWCPPGAPDPVIADASGHDLLALKIAAEGLDPRQVAADGGVSPGMITGILEFAVSRGLLLAPRPRITRPPGFPRGGITDDEFFTSPVFTLQWHITQRCDLHCRHCYDRSSREAMSLKQAIAVLDDTYDFCRSKHVSGQISFTGGNPFLYPQFSAVYREAANRGFMTAILGNPTPREHLEAIIAIHRPEFFQVSLEGMPGKNDDIRGQGHFDRVMAFLDTLRDLGVFSMVMLTLTEANAGDVLPLAAHLKGKADLFTFNRLAAVGEGAALRQAPPHDYPRLIENYLAAAAGHPGMGLKDNLINIALAGQGRPPFGGCTGHGCGAAFNFVSLLPDGEVHACRKFPSPIGHLLRERLADIYDGQAARRYRAGSAACQNCRLRPVCGGCMAVVYGSGLYPFTDRDPYCTID